MTAIAESLKIEGLLLEKGGPEYEEARTRNFAQNSHTREIAYPAYIAVVASVEDIQKCIKFAAKKSLTVTVRSGGHNWFGCYLRKDAFLIDMKNFDSLDIDASTKTAIVGPCVSGQVLNEEAAKHGLCFSTGHCSGVPLGGFLLGGGLGWFFPHFGYAAESLKEITVVDAFGNVIEASDDKQQDWMWLARGSASAFPGVVVSFKLALHPVPSIIRSKGEFHPLESFAKLAKFFRNNVEQDPKASSKCEFTLGLVCTPPPLLEVINAPKVLMVMTCCIADSEDEFKSLAEPLENMPSTAYLPGKFEDHSFKSLSDMLVDAFPPGMHWICTAHFAELCKGDEVAWDELKNTFEDTAPPLGLSKGMVAIGPERRTTKPGCYGDSTSGFLFMIFGAHGPDEDPAVAKEYVNAMGQYIEPATLRYDALEHPVNKETFEKSFTGEVDKLYELRSKFDPNTVFFDPSKVEPSH